MSKNRISYRLSIYILSTSIIVFTAVVMLNYRYTKRLLMEHIEENAISQSQLLIKRIARHIITAQEVTRNVSDLSLYFLKHNDLADFLENVLKSNPLLNSVHIDLKKEFFKTEEQVHYTACRDNSKMHNALNQHKKLYEQLEKSAAGFWSDPYPSRCDEKQMVVSYCYPIRQATTKEYIGMVSCEISMEYINEMASELKIGEEGIAFLINQSGLYLTHPQTEWVMKRNLHDLPQRVFPFHIDKLKQQILEKQTGSGIAYPDIFDNKKAWFYYTPMPYTSWIVVILIPTDELFRDLLLSFFQIVGVALIGLLLMFVVFVYIFRCTLTPLLQVTQNIQDFSFAGKKNATVKNEITSLIESLAELQNRYGQFKQEQTQNRKERRKLEKEMSSAKDIQETIVPYGYPAFPDREEFDLYAILKPAQIIGGDLYDYFFIDKNHLLFAIGDVSGKGIPAALFMAIADTFLKNNDSVSSAKHIVEKLNDKLNYKNSNQNFLTLFLGILDVENGILNYCNAAHCHPYVLRKNGSMEILRQSHGLPVGIYPNKSYKSSTVILKAGDTIFLYTDGVTECRNEKDEFYGQQKLENVLNGSPGLSCMKLVTKIENSLNEFSGSSVQTDDISLMALRYKGIQK